MPKKIEAKLKAEAKKKGLTGKRADAYVMVACVRWDGSQKSEQSRDG